MNRSLYSKLVLIMLLLIVSLMTIAGAFLVRGVRQFYLNDFYQQMQDVFSDEELVRDLRAAADEEAAAEKLADILRANYGQLGIDSRSRNFSVLSGSTGAYIIGSGQAAASAITPNVLTALAGEEGYESDPGADYMDVALPIRGQSGSYILHIVDNKYEVRSLSSRLVQVILISMGAGLAISALLSLLLAKTMVTPIQNLTLAAERVASGDFSDKLENEARDEIGVLTRTFSDMAGQLETTMDDLKKSEAMRREFVANVSHELRTPITSIRSYAETLAENPELPAAQEQEFLRVIVNESDRMTKIVQDLLTLSKFDAGSIEFVFERFSVEKSLRSVYSAMVIEARKHRHDFRLDIRSELPLIRGDKTRVEQVILNMVSNAVKYTPDGGELRMTAGCADGFVWITVKDNGVGIPKKDLDRVFERFYRVDKTRSREFGGTGLGLSIAREIVMRHDGRIDIQSRPGKGTSITVTLPVEGPADEG